MSETEINVDCPVCGNQTRVLGTQRGILDNRFFFIRNCFYCRFSFVSNYRDDYEKIYNEDYYLGFCADPILDYIYELDNQDSTIRNYEWQGIYEIFIKNFPKGGRWLDFGCGAGGLVSFGKKKGIDIIGAEDGWAAEKGREIGISILKTTELESLSECFDFISAIEVLEHISNPIETFHKIRKLLKPGGVLFLTTGNAKPWRNRLLQWSYTKCPDVHISFFEPHTLSICLESTGFASFDHNSFDGFTNIIKYKILKTMRVKNCNFLIDALPWGFIARAIDFKYQVSKHPYGVAI